MTLSHGYFNYQFGASALPCPSDAELSDSGVASTLLYVGRPDHAPAVWLRRHSLLTHPWSAWGARSAARENGRDKAVFGWIKLDNFVSDHTLNILLFATMLLPVFLTVKVNYIFIANNRIF